jgi:hypothetical protein
MLDFGEPLLFPRGGQAGKVAGGRGHLPTIYQLN